jgi:hypothetical protein
MRHIKLYEEYQDPLDPMARDMFGLTSEVLVWHHHNEWSDESKGDYVMVGPSEQEDEAKKLADLIRPHLAERGYEWQQEEDAREDAEDEDEEEEMMDLEDYIDLYLEKRLPYREAVKQIGYEIVWKPNPEYDY